MKRLFLNLCEFVLLRILESTGNAFRIFVHSINNLNHISKLLKNNIRINMENNIKIPHERRTLVKCKSGLMILYIK